MIDAGDTHVALAFALLDAVSLLFSDLDVVKLIDEIGSLTRLRLIGFGFC